MYLLSRARSFNNRSLPTACAPGDCMFECTAFCEDSCNRYCISHCYHTCRGFCSAECRDVEFFALSPRVT